MVPHQNEHMGIVKYHMRYSAQKGGQKRIDRLFLPFNGPDEYLWAENPLENLVLENWFPSTGNLKVPKELRVS